MPSKINLIIRLQHWMDSVPGQTFLNYAYSWGASIVILGALFKLTHLPGGNLMLFIGMGTEVVVFFLSAFDRPFDRQEIGKELPKTYLSDDEIEELINAGENDTDEPFEDAAAAASSETFGPSEISEFSGDSETAETAESESTPAQVGGAASYVGSAASYVGSAASQVGDVSRQNGPANPQPAPVSTAVVTDDVQTSGGEAQSAAPAAPTTGGIAAPADATAEQLAIIIRQANDELLHRAQVVLSPEMEQATNDYIEKLKTLNDTLAKVDEQNMRLTRDSEEMENLNRTLTGINKVYELHLKSISLQVGTIDDINNQTKKLAEQIQRLNEVYGRMIDALTVNMVRGGGSAAPAPGSAE